jgi:dTDP-4-dehydrorhamnose reductase
MYGPRSSQPAVCCAAAGRGWTVRGAYGRHPVRIPGVETQAVDLTDAGQTRAWLRRRPPRWIVHTAAATQVDWCEHHPDQARRVNVEASRTLAACARELGARLLYVSTDAVFDGERGGYREDDAPRPLSVYARSKHEGELAVQEILPEALVVRTNLYGWNVQDKQSLAEWIFSSLAAGGEVPGFADVIFSPLLSVDAAELLLDVIDRDAAGVFHAGSADAVSKFAFARMLARTCGLDPARVREASIDAAALAAPRPRRSWLDSGKLVATVGRPLPSIQCGLSRFEELRQSGFAHHLKTWKVSP